MEKIYLLDFCSKSILFLKFLELSLNKFSKYEKEKDINIISQLFEKDILQDTKNYNTNISLYQASKNGIKNKLIYEYAVANKYNKININCDEKDLNDFIDKLLFPQIVNKLGSLYRTKNKILKMIHHSLLNYLLSSQAILIHIKQCYCKRIYDSEDNEKTIKSLKEKINILSFENERLKKIYEEERKILEEKNKNKSFQVSYLLGTQSDHLIRELEKQLSETISKNINLEGRVTQLESEKLALKKNIEDLKIKDESLYKENDVLNKKYEILSKEHKDLNKKYDVLSKENKEVRKCYDDLNKRFELLIKEIASLKDTQKKTQKETIGKFSKIVIDSIKEKTKEFLNNDD